MVSALMPPIFLQAAPATAVTAAATAAVVTMAMVNFSSGQRNLVKTFHNQANHLLILKKMEERGLVHVDKGRWYSNIHACPGGR